MIEKELAEKDKERIKTDIKVTAIIGLIFSLALVTIVIIVPLIFFIFKKPAGGFIGRGLFITGLLFLPFIATSWTNILKFIDLKGGMKINFKTSDYEIKKEKAGFVLKVYFPIKLEFDLYDRMPSLLRHNDSLIIETTKLSKTLLFISQNSENLLERLEKEDNDEFEKEFNGK